MTVTFKYDKSPSGVMQSRFVRSMYLTYRNIENGRYVHRDDLEGIINPNNPIPNGYELVYVIYHIDGSETIMKYDESCILYVGE